MRFTRVAAVLAAMTLAASAAQAQSGQISVNATVLQALTVAAGQNLDFGNVTPNVPKTVAPTAGSAGRFDISGATGSSVNLTFTLPTTLTGTAGSLAVGSWQGLHNTVNNAATGTSFTPSASPTSATLTGGALFVYLGATVTPTAAQGAGTYTGQVTLNAVYQ